MKANDLYALVKSAAPIAGVTVGNEGDKATWAVDWGASSAPEIAAGEALIAAVSDVDTATVEAPRMNFDCKLIVTSSLAIQLSNHNGDQIFINGQNYPIAQYAVNLGNTGLAAATLYYVYAYWTGLKVALELSTTGHAVDPTWGHRTKGSTPSRTYVGMVYMGAGTPGTFVDSDTQRFCASYYNRINKPVQRALIANRATTAAPHVELDSAERIEFISHGDEHALVWLNAIAANSNAGTDTYGALGLDGISTLLARTVFYSADAGNLFAFGKMQGQQFSAGYHYLTPVGGTSGGGARTATYYAGGDPTRFGAMLRQ